MNTFKERLITESAELDTKLAKLKVFMETPAFHKIDPAQQSLLNIQAGAMDIYSMILAQRLKLLEEQNVDEGSIKEPV